VSAQARAFIDTTVLVYLLSGDAEKADRAEALIAAGGVVSVQVLNEFVSVARRKLDLSWVDIHDILGAVRANTEITPLTLAVHDRAIAIAQHSGLHIYDACIVAAAASAGCSRILTEDLQHGQAIDGALVENPFRA
jgi:predicted nucleic acid-binding protein